MLVEKIGQQTQVSNKEESNPNMKGKRKRQKAHDSNGSFAIKSGPNKGALQGDLIFKGNQTFLKIWLLMSSIDFHLKKYTKHFDLDFFKPKNKVKPKY